MKMFKDSKDREWSIVMTINVAKRIRDLLDVNLLA